MRFLFRFSWIQDQNTTEIGETSMKNICIKAFAILALATAIALPAGAGITGPNACKSWLPGVSTLDGAFKPKGCGATSWKDLDTACLTSLSSNHNSAKLSVIDFRERGFSGSVRVALQPNDSRLRSESIQDRNLGHLSGDDDRLNSGYIRFYDLQPRHYYAVVIYSPDDGYGISKPFWRQCFLTNRDPSTCTPLPGFSKC